MAEETKTNIDLALEKILATEKNVSTIEPTEAEKERFLSGYSVGALVYGTIYFLAVGDSTFAWTSLLGAFFFFPIIFILPLFARKRAWRKQKITNFNLFIDSQKRWDRWGWYGIVLSAVTVYLIFQFIFMPLVHSLLPGGTDEASLRQLRQELEDLQGL